MEYIPAPTLDRGLAGTLSRDHKIQLVHIQLVQHEKALLTHCLVYRLKALVMQFASCNMQIFLNTTGILASSCATFELIYRKINKYTVS